MSRRRYVITATAYDRKGNILFVKKNDYHRSHPLQKQMSIRAGMHPERISLHAEVAVIISAQRTRKRIDRVLVERYDAYGNPKLAKPCASCRLALELAGVKHVSYTTEYGVKHEAIAFEAFERRKRLFTCNRSNLFSMIR